MISASNSWKELHKEMLLPETFLEISCGLGDIGIHDLLTVSGNNEATFSNTDGIIDDGSQMLSPMYATLEHNLWLLDGSRSIFPASGKNDTPGYVNKNEENAGVVLSVSEVRGVPIPGFTITWSSEYGEYPTAFTVTAKNKDAVVATTTVTGNTSVVSEVALEIVDYDSVTITILEWNYPLHRPRIDLVSFGHVITFGKNDVLSFTHEQNGCLNCGELPKNSIRFTLDNSDDRWNPSNPVGMEKYLSERQRVTVRYGMDVNGKIEWIKAGTFYLSEWRTPSNGLEASFTARDALEYLLNEPYVAVTTAIKVIYTYLNIRSGPGSGYDQVGQLAQGDVVTVLERNGVWGRIDRGWINLGADFVQFLTTGTLKQLVTNSLLSADLPGDFVTELDDVLDQYTAPNNQDRTAAEVIQMCANASGCVVWQDRNGVLRIEPLRKKSCGYCVTSELSYSHPEVELTKQLKAVSVSYGDQTYVLPVGTSGETQTVNNPLVNGADQAKMIAESVRATLETRKTVIGEFRADPRLDLFDIINVESKYGLISSVAISNIKYTYSGSFHGNYTGKVITGVADDTLGEFVLGESTLAQGV